MTQTLPRAQHVAEYLVWLSAHERPEDPDYLTPLKLQKLMYFVQGWSLAESGRPMFAEPIEAWKHGPVVPEVFKTYRAREKLAIVPDPSAPPPDLSPEHRAVIRGVWDVYKRFSAFALSDMTHVDAPYVEAYAPDGSGRCSAVIETSAIARSFSARVDAAQTRTPERRDRLRAFAAGNTRRLTGRDVLE